MYSIVVRHGDSVVSWYYLVQRLIWRCFGSLEQRLRESLSREIFSFSF